MRLLGRIQLPHYARNQANPRMGREQRILCDVENERVVIDEGMLRRTERTAVREAAVTEVGLSELTDWYYEEGLEDFLDTHLPTTGQIIDRTDLERSEIPTVYSTLAESVMYDPLYDGVDTGSMVDHKTWMGLCVDGADLSLEVHEGSGHEPDSAYHNTWRGLDVTSPDDERNAKARAGSIADFKQKTMNRLDTAGFSAHGRLKHRLEAFRDEIAGSNLDDPATESSGLSP